MPSGFHPAVWPAKLLLSAELLLLAVTGCGPPAQHPSPRGGGSASVWFEDATARSGLDFTHAVETSGRYLFSETMGSGAAWLDFDQDGRLDVFLMHNVRPQTGATNRLFHQENDGSFRDVTAGSGLEPAGYGNGLAVGDLNNDGRPELLLTEFNGVRLFQNLGAGRFAEITLRAGLTNRQWSVAAAFFDYDRDGWLDLVLGNYLDFDPSQKCLDAQGRPDFCGPQGFRPTLTRLFHNVTAPARAGEVKFEEVTVAAGFARAPGKAMAILCTDFDRDGWPDVFITDDALPNRLFMNQKDGTFREEALRRGLAYTGTGAPAANMGIAIGDVDEDSLFDLFVPHLTGENHTLWRQIAPGLFRDDTAPAGLLALPWHGTGFGAVSADFDNDGRLDLAVVNGKIRRSPSRFKAKSDPGLPAFWQLYAEPSQLFAGAGNGRFREVSAANPVCAEAFVGRGLACGDVDNDGRLDLLATGIAGRARLWRNVSPGGSRHWLGVRAIDPAWGGRDAYGAEIVVQADGRSRWRLVQPAYSYASSNDPRAHFGLGAGASFASIAVRWPDGRTEMFPGGPADRYLTLRRGEGKLR